MSATLRVAARWRGACVQDLRAIIEKKPHQHCIFLYSLELGMIDFG